MPNSQRPTVVIFSQGDEVMTGATVDTNAAYLAQHCHDLGLDIIRHITVADDMSVLVDVLRDIDQMADVCLCTGGLGPTQDDLTTEAYSRAFDVPLQFDEDAYEMMAAYFDKLNVPMADVNRKQALLPEQSTRIDNHWGTAAGFIGTASRCRFYFMPGVPYEMRNMMHSAVLDDLKQQFNIEKPRLITLRTMGMGESSIQQIVNELAIPDNIRVSFRAGLPENEFKLTFPHAYPDDELRRCVAMVEQALAPSVFAIDGLDGAVLNLADCVDQLMVSKGLTLSVIETLSQGVLSKQCQASWLNNAQLYPISERALQAVGLEEGIVTEETAVEVAKHLFKRESSNLVLVQLYWQKSKNKSDIFTAVVDNTSHLSSTREVTGRTERQQIVSAAAALNLIRKKLLSN
ncbi:MAG: competence/damage-inducible protein A [Piscirickettsiaceae bacterium]|nr:MAG: competence/damage-inducible protein A [Piscirickettsiaceae bacterium]PCI70616.1 MAG: competence/damage-inducible protein A [Piscirickettsiaceae bacterium]